MSVRNLNYLFSPRSIALIGASDQRQSVGAVLTANLLSGGFGGPVDLVNPRLRSLGGVRVHRDVASLPEPPDLAVLATPAATVPDLIEQLAEAGLDADDIAKVKIWSSGTLHSRLATCTLHIGSLASLHDRLPQRVSHLRGLGR